MGSGKYRNRITLQRPKSVEGDEFNQVDLTDDSNWQDFVLVSAEVKPINSKENLRNGQIVLDVSHTVTFRWFPGVTSAMRIKYGCKTLQIEGGINVDERRREYVLTCQEVA